MIYKLLPSNRFYVHLIFWVLALFHLFIPVYNHFVYRTYCYDLAAYNFAFYDFAHFRNSPCLFYFFENPMTFWQDHFSLLLPILSPLYWILAPVFGTYSLIIVQWIFITAGALFTYRLIKHFTAHELMPLLSIVLYFMIHGRYSAYRTDVNIVIMASAIVPAFMYFFYTGRKAATWITFFLLLVMREDFSLWCIFICLFLASDKRIGPLRKQAFLMAGLSLIFFALCFILFIPLLIETNGRVYSLFEYRVLGQTPVAAIKYIIHDPVRVFQLLFINHSDNGYYDNIKADFYVCYLVSGMGVLLLRPRYLIPLLPLFAKKMWNDHPVRWGMESYYAVEFATLLPLLLFMIIVSFRKTTVSRVVAITVCALAIVCTFVRFNIQPVSLVADDGLKSFPFSSKFYGCSFDRKAVEKAIAMIPDNVSVTASPMLTAHLAFRDQSYLFPRRNDESWAIILNNSETYPLSKEAFEAEVSILKGEEGGMKVVSDHPDVFVLKPALPRE
jgi:uncharacterized membrane protein